MPVQDGEIVKMVAEFSLPDNTIAQNIFYFIAKFAATQTNGAVKQALQTWAEDAYMELTNDISSVVTDNAFRASTIAWDSAEGKWLMTEDLGPFYPTITFVSAAQSLPNATAPTAFYPTDRPKSRGRKQLIPFSESSVDENTLTTAALSALLGFVADTLLDVVIDGSNVLSPGIVRTAADTFLEYTEGQANDILGSMRTRKPGIGA